MDRLDETAERLSALERTDRSRFQRVARVLQSLWREEQGYPMGMHRGRKLGSSLPMPWAEETMVNFLTPTVRKVVREEVCNPAKAADKLYDRRRLFSNLLSSQPLAFNLFAHLKTNLPLASKVFDDLLRKRCSLRVTGIEFEHSPGRGDPRYTADRSAFDVFVTYEDPQKGKGFVGIEVKYHEDMSQSPSRHNPRYDEVAAAMGCFKDECLDRLGRKPFQQIWRDHLLAGSLLLAGEFDEGRFVFLSPQHNEACNKAVAGYLDCLSDERTCEYWTLESIVEAIGDNTRQPWIKKLSDRYLAFGKLTALTQ